MRGEKKRHARKQASRPLEQLLDSSRARAWGASKNATRSKWAPCSHMKYRQWCSRAHSQHARDCTPRTHTQSASSPHGAHTSKHMGSQQEPAQAESRPHRAMHRAQWCTWFAAGKTCAKTRCTKPQPRQTTQPCPANQRTTRRHAQHRSQHQAGSESRQTCRTPQRRQP